MTRWSSVLGCRAKVIAGLIRRPADDFPTIPGSAQTNPGSGVKIPVLSATAIFRQAVDWIYCFQAKTALGGKIRGYFPAHREFGRNGRRPRSM
jgi:hypothetical protein